MKLYSIFEDIQTSNKVSGGGNKNFKIDFTVITLIEFRGSERVAIR